MQQALMATSISSSWQACPSTQTGSLCLKARRTTNGGRKGSYATCRVGNRLGPEQARRPSVLQYAMVFFMQLPRPLQFTLWNLGPKKGELIYDRSSSLAAFCVASAS